MSFFVSSSVLSAYYKPNENTRSNLLANYYIGGNDEHGQNPFTAGKRTPVMPYLNVPFYENQFNRPAKIRFLEGCLRNNFAVFDVKPELTDTPVSTRVRRINAQNLTLLVTFGYNAFGSGNSFNSAKGISLFYSDGNPRPAQSRALAEEIYEQTVRGSTRTRSIVIDRCGSITKRQLPFRAVRAGIHDQFR